jgi:hypothetical protein
MGLVQKRGALFAQEKQWSPGALHKIPFHEVAPTAQALLFDQFAVGY